ncbi:MAG: sigma-70 family RNA polymerase sigma factor [Cytophaga sp.]|uniref:sigma-70 family RNA polymerase sigma factor n=1 Tax=Cytophaga sp. TaxID=29535 RepID=UPI003F80048D
MDNASKIIKEWVDEFSSDMFSWAFYKTSNKETAKDLVQETFIAAFESFKSFENRSKPKTWLFSILKNKIIDHHRKLYKNNIVSSDKIYEEHSTILFSYLFNEEGEWREKNSVSSLEENSIELLDDFEFNEVLSKCFQKLPVTWNSAIQLKYLEDKDAKDICQELDVSTSNYWQIIHRAKLQLRACLEEDWFKK